MKTILRNILILAAPFLIMIVVNEIYRPTIKETPYSMMGITAMNSALRMEHKCSWICHNDTRYCQQYHTTFMGKNFHQTDPIYYGAIGLLMSTGAYGPANILVFVIIFPLAIWMFIVLGLRIQRKINLLKN